MPDTRDRIGGGFLLLSRRILESEVFEDPDRLKLWLYLLGVAHWSDRPVRHPSGVLLQKGELYVSSAQLAKILTRRGNRRRGEQQYIVPSRQQIVRMLDWFVRENMIYCEIGRDGHLVRIENYHYYQNPNSYAGSQCVMYKSGIPQSGSGVSAPNDAGNVTYTDALDLPEKKGEESSLHADPDRDESRESIESTALIQERNDGVDLSLNGSDPMERIEWRVWNEVWVPLYEQRWRVLPSMGRHTTQQLLDVVRQLRYQVKRAGRAGADDDVVHLARVTMRMFLAQKDQWAVDRKHKLGIYHDRLPELLEQIFGGD